ncbi:EAL domain-containing protein [Limnobacter humi]|uniref:EAL domain-containing protein n=1 Tax=Limnobacter humi TaxID=1778671 RepID=A0ABT1WJY2_9BURK|nr:EAL domain-containing protein [Limnobacter humi]MCQ8897351.1 EAL domain-containing protein [Limnobacter humi]
MNSTAQSPCILIVDDSEDDFVLIARQLHKTWPTASLFHAADKAALVDALQQHDADVVICDYSMPELTHDHAADLLEQYRPGTPLILLSGLATEAHGIAAMHAGVRDYVEKSKPERLVPAIRRELDTLRLRREKHLLEQAHRRAVYFDASSGFLNREGLLKALSGLMVNHAQGQDLCLFSIQLSRHQMRGMELDPRARRNMLDRVVGRVREVFPNDILCRWSDTTLVVVSNGFDWAHPDNALLERLSTVETQLNRPFLIENISLRPRMRLGLARPGRDGAHAAELVTHAQAVAGVLELRAFELFRAVESEVHSLAKRRRTIELGLAKGIENHQLVLNFQPIEDLKTGQVCGLEALVRWTHPELGLIMPGEFIQVAEDTGLIEALGDWVIRSAARHVKAFHTAGHPLWCSVNCSVGQLMNPDFPAKAVASIRDSGLDTHWIEFEVTESAAIDHMDNTVAALNQLRAAGCSIAMDDFGTGYASLNYLRLLPMNVLKIDKSFVSDLLDSPSSRKIVQAVIDLAHALSLVVHAEGIETAEQRQALVDMGCDRLQGYLFSKPLGADALLCWLNKGAGPGPA